jgi:hypothetical protein
MYNSSVTNLFPGQLSLVILEIVQLGVVRFNSVQQEIAVFLQERINAQIHAIQTWVEANVR